MAISFDGDFTVATPRQDAYDVLSDIQKFAPLLPSYKSHVQNEDGSVDVNIKVGVGKIRGSAKVNLILEESEAPIRAKYLGKGTVMGGVFNIVAGFELEDTGQNETHVKWQGELLMFGKLVSLAGGMIKPIAKKDIGNMIEAIRIALSGDAEAAAAEDVSVDKKSGSGKLGKLRALLMKFVSLLGGLLRK